MSKRRLLDTNVLLVAEGLHQGADESCVDHCQQALIEFVRSGHLVLDDGWRILNEYGHKLSAKVAQPGMGRAFLKWAHQNHHNRLRCTPVPITPLSADPECTDFAEFPAHPDLAHFDRSDRKFVAVAVAHGPPHPVIVQAADSKWIGWRDALAEECIDVEFLCEDALTDTWRRKTRR